MIDPGRISVLRFLSDSDTIQEILSRRFLLVGFIAVTLMLPLAVTSTNAMIRKLGPGRLPGQYMNLALSIGGQTIKRSYTIASSPTQRGHVELTIKRNPEGLASRYMHDQLKIGDKIRIGAPAGKFFFHDFQSKGVVLIAGGVGITPLMSILRNLTDHSWKGNIYFINAMRSREDRIFENEFASLANRFENLMILDYYSQSKPSQVPSPSGSDPTERWQDKSGYINAADLSAFVPNLNELPIFLCGPDPMMQVVRKAMVSLGIPDEQISTEEFISPRANAVGDQTSSSVQPTDTESFHSLATTITFATSNQTIDVDASTTILEAAEQAGVTLPWECRAGICGQCKVRCTTGRVRMDSQPLVFFDKDQRSDLNTKWHVWLDKRQAELEQANRLRLAQEQEAKRYQQQAHLQELQTQAIQAQTAAAEKSAQPLAVIKR